MAGGFSGFWFICSGLCIAAALCCVLHRRAALLGDLPLDPHPLVTVRCGAARGPKLGAYASCAMADDLDCSENDRNDRISITLPRRLRQRLRERAVAALHPEAAEARQLLAWALQSKEERAA